MGNTVRRPRRHRTTWAACALFIALPAAVQAPVAHARGNASAAAGFIEAAQNRDGGFGGHRGQGSQPVPTLWAAVALLAAGKHPRDEWLKGGRSADQYLATHRDDLTSLRDLGLL